MELRPHQARNVRALISHERLLHLVTYDPEMGFFRWNFQVGSHGVKDAIAGGLDNRGYWALRLDGKAYQAHRLAWFYMTGKWPKDQIDHANLRRSDNRLENLRECDNSQNNANRKAQSNNTLGTKGVHFNKSLKKFRAQIKVRGKRIHIGLFDSLEQAATAYSEAAAEHFAEFARS